MAPRTWGNGRNETAGVVISGVVILGQLHSNGIPLTRRIILPTSGHSKDQTYDPIISLLFDCRSPFPLPKLVKSAQDYSTAQHLTYRPLPVQLL